MVRRRDVLPEIWPGGKEALQGNRGIPGRNVFHFLFPGILWNWKYDAGKFDFQQYEERVRASDLGYGHSCNGGGRNRSPGGG